MIDLIGLNFDGLVGKYLLACGQICACYGTKILHRTELQIFKARFMNWDEVLAVDFTRTPEMLEQRKKELVSECMVSDESACVFERVDPGLMYNLWSYARLAPEKESRCST